jgi:hypothetical protein
LLPDFLQHLDIEREEAELVPSLPERVEVLGEPETVEGGVALVVEVQHLAALAERN